MPARLFSDEVEREIAAAYQEVGNQEEVARRFGCSPIVVRRILIEHNIPIRTSAEVVRNPNTRHDFFSVIDSEKKSYLLGFITADGCVMDKGVVTIGLAIEDLPFLEMIRDTLAPTVGINIQPAKDVLWKKTGKTHRQQANGKLTVSSPQIIADLLRHGVGPRKTPDVKPWTADSIALQCAYWRGCIDGNGSISVTDCHGHAEWCIGISGNQFMVQGFTDFAQLHTYSPWSTKPKKITKIKHADAYQVSFSGTHLPRQIAVLLYENSSIHLPRKKASADRLIASVPPMLQ